MNNEGVPVFSFSSELGSNLSFTLLPAGVGAVNCVLQQGKPVLAGPFAGGEVGIGRNAQGMQLALATDGALGDYLEDIPEITLLARTTSRVPSDIETAVAPGRFQIAILTPMPPAIMLIDLAPVRPPMMRTSGLPSTAGELYVIGNG